VIEPPQVYTRQLNLFSIYLDFSLQKHDSVLENDMPNSGVYGLRQSFNVNATDDHTGTYHIHSQHLCNRRYLKKTGNFTEQFIRQHSRYEVWLLPFDRLIPLFPNKLFLHLWYKIQSCFLVRNSRNQLQLHNDKPEDHNVNASSHDNLHFAHLTQESD